MLTIGQLAKRVGLRTSTLRYYEDEGLLQPSGRSPAGYRLYDGPAEQTLRFIQRAQRIGFSLSDIRQLLNERDGEATPQPFPQSIVHTAERRYIALEQQVTELLVLRHEMGLFLQDLHQRTTPSNDPSTIDLAIDLTVDLTIDTLFSQLVEQVCANPANQSPTATLDWLMARTGCCLTSDEGQKLLDTLRGQHIHIWQENSAYHILVVSREPKIGAAIEAIASLEANCQAHPRTHPTPEFKQNEEGYLLITRGENGFLFARLFLSLVA